MFTEPHLRFCLDVLGPERLVYTVDYPFVGNAERLMPALA